MNRIILFFKNLFSKSKKKVLEEKYVMQSNDEQTKEMFVQEMKQKMSEKNKGKIETLVCTGDGLGIQNTANF